MQHEKEALIALAFSGVIGPKRYAHLLDIFGAAENIIKATRTELCESLGVKVGDKVYDAIDGFNFSIIDTRLKTQGITALTLVDAQYPQRLKKISDPPLVLFCKGKTLHDNARSIAIVGARKATGYGLLNARKIARELAEAGLLVVSGMAYGIDSEAHRGALEANGGTTAVLGSGVDVCYPASHVGLYNSIVLQGSVVSEFIPGTKPYAGNFPARNRIISALADSVFVVEAAAGSGTLITVDFALEQGKDVFALPGNVGQTNSEGTNRLIQQGAKLIIKAEDILEEYGLRNIQRVAPSEEDALLNLIGQRLLAFDDLLYESGLSVEVLQSKLILLELAGKIVRQGDVVYLRSSK